MRSVTNGARTTCAIFVISVEEEEINLILFVLFVLYVHLYLTVPIPDTYITEESY